ncbi:MAG: conserved rane protein of unknown function [Rhodospirillales bacterium]|nr:conserved rane protein of unknown function [Rhodospirillales bacterium]
MIDQSFSFEAAPEFVSPSQSVRWRQRLATLSFAVLAVALTIHLALPLLTLTAPFDLNYNEGWNAYHAARILAGGPLYTGDVTAPVNYPFLSFYLTAAFAPWLGGVVIAGRILSLAGLLVTAGAAGFIVQRLGGRRTEAAITMIAVLGFWVVQARQWTAVDDPQALGQAFMTLALACHVGGARSLRRLWATALLVGLGAFTKHNLIAIPVAITLDLALHQRRSLLPWLGGVVGTLGALAGISHLVAGGDFLREMLAPRAWHFINLERHTRKFLIGFKLPFVAMLLLVGGSCLERGTKLVGLYFVTAFLAGLGFSGGDGVSFNIYLDTTVALAIGVGLALSHWRGWLDDGPQWRRLFRALLPLLLLSPLITRASDPLVRLRVLGSEGMPIATAAADFARNKAIVERQPGPAICENLLLCFAADKPLSLDPFNSYEAFTAGHADDTALVQAVARGTYGAIEVRQPIRFQTNGQGGRTIDLDPPIRFTDRFYAAVADHYRIIVENSAGVVYVPR